MKRPSCLPPELPHGALWSSPKLQVTSCTFSQRGTYHYHALKCPSHVVVWDPEHLYLMDPDVDNPVVAVLEWQHVSAIWVSLRTKTGEGFFLNVALETIRGELDFLRFTALMNEAGGKFLSFLQVAKADNLKKEPRRSLLFVMSHWATPLYRKGVSSKRLRVIAGWVSAVFEVLFAFCFIAQMQGLLGSRGGKLMEALSEIYRVLIVSGGLAALVLVLRHLVVFLFLLRGLGSTTVTFLLSLRTIRHGASKTTKTFKKLSPEACKNIDTWIAHSKRTSIKIIESGVARSTLLSKGVPVI